MEVTADPLPALLGGVVIGIAVLWNALLFGQVTGISGTLYRAASGDAIGTALAVGLLASGFLAKNVLHLDSSFSSLDDVPIQLVIAAAVLVGVGAGMANGCTSGHGVCGLSRLSLRSAAAVMTFFSSAVPTATLTHSSSLFPHQLQVFPPVLPALSAHMWLLLLSTFCFILPPALMFIQRRVSGAISTLFKRVLSFCIGLLFGVGLIICRMSNPKNVLMLLDLRSTPVDLSMLFVFAGCLPIAFVAFRAVLGGRSPLLAVQHSLPTRKDIDIKLLVGAALFGIGWGLLGLCPGPVVVSFGANPTSINVNVFMFTVLIAISVGRSTGVVIPAWFHALKLVPQTIASGVLAAGRPVKF